MNSVLVVPVNVYLTSSLRVTGHDFALHDFALASKEPTLTHVCTHRRTHNCPHTNFQIFKHRYVLTQCTHMLSHAGTLTLKTSTHTQTHTGCHTCYVRRLRRAKHPTEFWIVLKLYSSRGSQGQVLGHDDLLFLLL